MNDAELAPLEAGNAPASERELKAVLADLFEHTQTLVKQEVELGKTEIDVRVGKAKAALVRGAIAGGLYHAAYLTTLATIVLLLSHWVALWVASLIIAVAASAGAVVFTLLGRQALHEVKDPPETRPLMRQRAHT